MKKVVFFCLGCVEGAAEGVFEVGDSVMYGNTGVCKILDIRKERFLDQEALYYILQPINDAYSKIYCPVDNDQQRLRKLLSAEEIRELIRSMPGMKCEWIENDHERKEAFMEILQRGDHQELIKLIRTLHENRELTKKTGRKFHQSDANILSAAEKLLHGEFAHVLHLNLDDVVPFILGTLNPEEKQTKDNASK